MIIDFHSHILPGADHGCVKVSEARTQLTVMRSEMTDIAVATPHFYPHRHNVAEFIKIRDDALSALLGGVGEDKWGISLALGAEALACENIDRLPDIENLCIRGTRCLLLEMPASGDWSESLLESVVNLIDDGYDVVLAHIDRYLKRYEDDIDRLISMGAMAQINADAFSGFGLRKKLMAYIDGGYVYALGSDLHGTDKRAYKNFAHLEKYVGKANFEAVMKKTEQLLGSAELISL